MPEGTDLYKKGMAKRRQLMGDAAVEAASKGVYADPVMQKFLDVAVENVFGNLWTRPGLDDKTRALICVVSDTCTGREPELELHLRMALRQGWTEDELTEVMLHLSGYIGVPIIRELMMVASRVFKEHRGEPAGAEPLRVAREGGGIGSAASVPGTLARTDSWFRCSRIFRSRRGDGAASCWQQRRRKCVLAKDPPRARGRARDRARGRRRSPAWRRCR